MKGAQSLLVGVVILLASVCVNGAASSGEVKVEEQIAGPAKAGGVYAISPRGAHVAYAGNKGSRLVVAVDGVEGPVFDELFEPHGGSFFSPQQLSVLTAGTGGLNTSTVTPVIYSANGLHFAYAGRQGNDYVVIHDGKEVGRGPRQALALNYGTLTMSPSGKYVYWDEMQTAAGRGSWRLMMNGKPGPWTGHQTMTPVFSADDSRFAYTTVSMDDRNKQSLIVDGKDAGYFGSQPEFSADNSLLFTISNVGPKPVLQINGKSTLEGIQISKLVTAPVGNRYAALVRTKVVGGMGVDVLFLDGKEVPGTDGVLTLVTVADDVVKRYRITASPDMNVAKLITDAETIAAKAAADAEKAKADAAAAKAKADADAKEAAAKAKADAEAALAAKIKARQDALDAKAKARQDALDAKAKARADAAAAKKRPAE